MAEAEEDSNKIATTLKVKVDEVALEEQTVAVEVRLEPQLEVAVPAKQQTLDLRPARLPFLKHLHLIAIPPFYCTIFPCSLHHDLPLSTTRTLYSTYISLACIFIQVLLLISKVSGRLLL